jgi:predicted transcriptional regulator of viral defense system
MKRRLGNLEQLLLAYTQMRGVSTLRTGELTRPLRLSAKQERELLGRMARAGLIARVRRGLYLVPPRLPLGGLWSPDPALALATLIEDRGGRYQICGANAFNRYGFDNQVPNRIYAYNNRISGDRRIGTVQVNLIKVSDRRLGDTEEQLAADGRVAIWSSRVRTLVDAVYDWSRFNGLPRAYQWIRQEIIKKRVDAADLVRVTIRYGDKGTLRRIGALLEREGISDTLLRKLERALPDTSSPIPWIPTARKRGPVSQRWGVVLNGDA